MSRYSQHSLISDYLEQLGVPHTFGYSTEQFRQMPFQTMFGLVKLLESYGVRSAGYRLKDTQQLAQLTPPFLAQTRGGMVIVTGVGDGGVRYLTQGVEELAAVDDFKVGWTGNVILSFPAPDAAEPHYLAHRRIDLLMASRWWVMAAAFAAVFVYLFVTRGLYSNIWTILLTVLDLCGLFFSYLLVQKSANIHSGTANAVCGVVQEGGCDKVLASDASTFFGLFGWAEVGFAYFSVSLAAMLLFPSLLPMLALCNLCCLPFPFWSVWYQKFRARHWCTLCLGVQATLVLLFVAYLCGGWVSEVFPIRFTIIILGCSYLGVMLAANGIVELISKRQKGDKHE